MIFRNVNNLKKCSFLAAKTHAESMGDKFIHRIICVEVENLNWNPKNVNELFQARPECEGLQLKLLWKETRDWRQH